MQEKAEHTGTGEIPALWRFQRGVELFRDEVFTELPLQQLYMVLITARYEGLSQQDFMSHLNVPAGTVSRNLSKLGSKFVEDRSGNLVDVGYGLLETRSDPDDSKKNTVHLTKRGKRFIQKLKECLE